jgi:Ca2+/H+ antiporter, TMEM165/GDT1 family
MNQMIPAFIAVLLCELGGASQRILADNRANKVAFPMLVALSMVAMIVAVVAGALVAPMITAQAKMLMLGLVLLVSGAVMLVSRRSNIVGGGKPNSAQIGFALGAAQFGGYGSFIVFALTAVSAQPLLAAMGGIAGVLVGVAPVMLAEANPEIDKMLLWIRRGAGVLMIATGLWTVSATI